MIIDYNNSNEETGRFGSGYYLLKSGNYTINGEQVTLNSDYVINYNNNKLIPLTNKYVEWSTKTTLAVSEGLALNVDPSNLADGTWSGVTKYGDVEYDSKSKALLFNEDEENNPTGNGGYLEYNKSGLDFSKGFTFEIYANLSRLLYDNGLGLRATPASGIFCKMPTLNSRAMHSMRFGYDGSVCKFYNGSSWSGRGDKMQTSPGGNVSIIKESDEDESCGYSTNEDFYLTFVYRRYNETDEDVKAEMEWTEEADRVEYYINGKLYGYTYYGIDSYDLGCDIWNVDTSPLFVGVCPWSEDGNLYYLKGKVYTCRLYELSMTAEQVKDNVDMTQKYISSF